MAFEIKHPLTRRGLMAGVAAAALVASIGQAEAVEAAVSVATRAVQGAFPLIRDGRPAAILVDPSADPAVGRVARRLMDDLERVSGVPSRLIGAPEQGAGPVVIIGVVGQCPVIDALVRGGKLDVAAIAGKWEGYVQSVVPNPSPGVAQALVIAGADRRGAVYGAHDISERIGVSPWYWFADAPVTQRRDVYLTAGARADWPRVKYRGIFINDEDPCFSGWAQKKFGGVNAEAYEHVFELILRLKGNYLWPAMWQPKSFHLDDPRSRVVADEMGVVMGTSHHEPLTRAQAEWHRLQEPWAGGAWDYAANGENLRRFWRGGIERMMSKGGGKTFENLVTIGMRGDGDAPMAEGTAVDLLETIVRDQRQIIADVTGKPASETPQMWALYKEVQDYYDHGMRAPDDVTLLFADDNWGQVRRLPTGGSARKGGYGVYYHLEYVGAPRNYKWINTNQIGKVWQQMNLAYERGARDIWIVNVGDIKPLEHPTDFFMKMAWNPEAMTLEKLAAFPQDWAGAIFGAERAREIGRQMALYSQYAARRKPELIDEHTWPIGEARQTTLVKGEFDAYVDQWRVLVAEVQATKARLRPEQRDAYFQLVEFPVLAVSNLYEMYLAAAWNQLLAAQSDPRANIFKAKVEAAFARDGELVVAYHAFNHAKWDGMMAQVHMSYTRWNDPPRQLMPTVMPVADASGGAHTVVFVDPPRGHGAEIVLRAADFTRATGAGQVGGSGPRWTAAPLLGQSGACVVALPQGRPPSTQEDGVRMEYALDLAQEGAWRVALHMLPTLDTIGRQGVRVGVSVDDGPMQTLSMYLEPTAGGTPSPAQTAWRDAVIDNRHILTAALGPLAGRRHTLKIWRLDDNAVIEKVVLTPA